MLLVSVKLKPGVAYNTYKCVRFKFEGWRVRFLNSTTNRMFLIGQNKNSPRNHHNFFSEWWTDARRPPIDFCCPVKKIVVVEQTSPIFIKVSLEVWFY